MAIDPDTLAAARHRIQSLPPPPRTTQVELIARLLPEINAARARGLPLEAIIPILREAGCTLSDKTIRNYVSQARRACALSGMQPSTSPTPPPSPPPGVATRRQASREMVRAPAPPLADNGDLPPGHFRIIPDTPDI